MRLISESGHPGEEIREARALLEKAEFVFFLGFGYSEANLETIGIALGDPDTTYRGTAFGLGGTEQHEVLTRFPKLSLVSSDCLGFFRDDGIVWKWLGP